MVVGLVVEEEVDRRRLVVDGGGREEGLAMEVETRAGLVTMTGLMAAVEARMEVPMLEEGVREVREEGLVVESPLRGAVVVEGGAREVEGGGGRAREEEVGLV